MALILVQHSLKPECMSTPSSRVDPPFLGVDRPIGDLQMVVVTGYRGSIGTNIWRVERGGLQYFWRSK